MSHAKNSGLAALTLAATLIGSLMAFTSPDAATSPLKMPNSEVTMALYASYLAPRGWSTSPGAEAEPGPTIVVDVGDNITVSLTSEDGRAHAFWVDYDRGSGASPDIDPDEPLSPTFGTSTITYTFMARRDGRFTYYCAHHYPAMFGTFVVRQPPIIFLGAPFIGGDSLTGGMPQVIEFSVLDSSPPDEIALWVNYSYDNDGQRGTIAGPIQARTYPDPIQVPWTPPRVNATDATINITAIDSDGMVSYQGSTFQIDSTPPIVMSTFPASDATDVSVERIRVMWSENMDWNTALSPAAFGLRRIQDGTWIPGEFCLCEVNETTFVLDAPLAQAEEYEAVVNASAEDDSRPGNPAVPMAWRFTTAIDATPPVISDVGVTPRRALTTESVSFSVMASDDRLMFRVFIHIIGPNTNVNGSILEEAGRWQFTWHFEIPGTYNFTIWAVDAGGNFASRRGSLEVITPSVSEPFPVVALGLLGVAAAATVVFWMIRRRRRSQGPPT